MSLNLAMERGTWEELLQLILLGSWGVLLCMCRGVNVSRPKRDYPGVIGDKVVLGAGSGLTLLDVVADTRF